MNEVELLKQRVEELEKQVRAFSDYSSISYEQSRAIEYKNNKVLFGKAVVDFASVNGGNSTNVTVKVQGARLGDPCIVSPKPNDDAGTAFQETARLFSAYVTADDVVTLKFDNQTAGAIDLGASEVIVAVLKQ